MSDPPSKVSVVIPVYNRERYVRTTIESVLQQSYRHIELIVVDDGSNDGSRAAIESFGDRLRLLEHPGRANKGQSAALNLGLAHATGRYIAFLDSDDVWMPDKLAVQVRYLEQHADVGLVYGNGIAIDENGHKLYDIYRSGHHERSDPCRVLLDCYFLLPNNALLRRELMERAGGFDESLRAAQDHDMAIRVAELTRLAYIDQPVFCYRRHPDSISSRKVDIRWQNGFRILEKAAARYPYPRAIVRKRRAVLHFRMAQCRVEQRRYVQAAGHLLAALSLDPLRSLSVLSGREPVTSHH